MRRKLYHNKGVVLKQEQALADARVHLVSAIKGMKDIKIAQNIAKEKARVQKLAEIGDSFTTISEEMMEAFGRLFSAGSKSSIMSSMFGMSRLLAEQERQTVNVNRPTATDAERDAEVAVRGVTQHAVLIDYADMEPRSIAEYAYMMFGTSNASPGIMHMLETVKDRESTRLEKSELMLSYDNMIVAASAAEDMYAGHPKAVYFRMQDRAELDKRRVKREPRQKMPRRVYSR